jgi:Spy/CpxP family protein refolding chaperone
MVKSRSSAILSVALVFLSGALVGAVANRLYMVTTVSSTATSLPPRPPDRNPEEVRKRLVAEMRTEVKLDDQQVKDLEKIYDRTREQFDDLHKHFDTEGRAVRDKQTEAIKALLRPEQEPLYDQLRAKHEAERKARHKNDKDDKGDRKP